MIGKAKKGRSRTLAAGGLLVAASLASGCTDSPLTEPPPTYTVGVTVSGLAGSGLVLRDNDGDDLSVTADGPVVFATPLASGAAYHVTVFAQPSSPAQSCVVTGGTGTMSHADVTNIAATCTTASSVAVVRLTPSSLEIMAGGQQLMSAVPLDAGGNVIAAPCVWTTSDTAVAAMSSAGALSAVAPGTAVVAAACGGGSGTAGVIVLPSALGTHAIAFVSAAPGGSRWYRMDGSGRALIREVAATETQPVLSPDGLRIAFASRGGDSGAGIFVMGSDGSAAFRLTKTPRDSTSVPIGWSRDGTRVFYLTSALNARRAHTADLSVVNAGGGAPVGLVTIPHSWGHALSPDGSMIAFSSDTSGTAGDFTTELHVMRTDGTHEQALATAGPEIPFPVEPAWSPDGQWIAFSSDGCDIYNLSNLYRVRADGSDPTLLARIDPGTRSDPSDACVGAPAWSPDGTRLAVSTHVPSGSPSAGFTSTLVDASGGQLGPRNPTASWVSRSAWSQDGTVLAILQDTSVDDPEASLYLSSPAGARPVLVAGQVSGMVFLR